MRLLVCRSLVKRLCALVASLLLSIAGASEAAATVRMPIADPPANQAAAKGNGLLLEPRSTSDTVMLSRQGRKYRILISAPQGAQPVGGFPVVYVLDGDAWTGIALNIAKMREYEKLPPAVIVGVGSLRHFFFDAEGRTRDFTPPHSDDTEFRAAGLEMGGADQFLSFLNETLKPWVRAHYSINPDGQTLFGHSLGGLFVLYAMFRTPESFHTYLAASPSIWFSAKQVLQAEAAFEANPARRRLRVLVTVGELESHLSPALEADYRRYFTAHPEAIPGQTVDEAIVALRGDSATKIDMIGDARELAKRLAQHGVRATFVDFPGEEHLSAGVSALNRGIPFALRPDQ